MTTKIAEYNATEAGLAQLREMYGATVWVVDTPDRMAGAKKARAEIKKWRIDLEAERKRIKRPALDRCKDIDTEAQRLTAEFMALEEPVDYAIKEVEQAKKREEEAKAKAEAERVEKCRAEIDRIRNIPADVAATDIGEIRAAAEELKAVGVSTLDEFADEAAVVREEAVEKLRKMYSAAVAQEEEQARLAAEREELEKLRTEQAERDRVAREAEADEQAEREAEDKARREKIEAEEKAAKDRIAEGERRAREVREKADAEARESRAKQEAEARKARAAEDAKLQKERERIADQEREARLAREKADAEARKVREAEEARLREERKRVEAKEREARLAQEKAENAECERVEDLRKAEADRKRADQEEADEIKREVQRKKATLLDGRAMLETFVERFGDVPEFATVAGQIKGYLAASKG